MRIRIVDAFTDTPFRGNPAGVCLLPAGDWPAEAWMASVAAELNLAETAFAKPSGDPAADWDLRWFTPAVEVDLCGHATLATAHVLGGDAPLRFLTRSGVLVTSCAPDGTVTMDFPANPPTPVEAPPGLAEALGAYPEKVFDTGALGDLVVDVADEATVRGLAPDLRGLAGFGERCVIVTARGDGDHDFVSRVFCPAVGIDEDPVTGSAHTALGPLWADRLGRATLVGVQASARSGRVEVEVDGDRVRLRGRAVTMLDGELAVQP
ncbi:PhzF family phenazine biosynthesis protein [Hamadaea tsunoensis]|uniref:PhzF family phenazine biosynthesis protein n=1 Tax=Hamadaea tsunoensis TaxID=53368 RepID=UPI0003FB1044|nr:PhzF family phenazine biosynthesis protein [Hamadaea tsunoensis]